MRLCLALGFGLALGLCLANGRLGLGPGFGLAIRSHLAGEMRQLLAEASILQLLEELEEKLKEMTKKCKAARSRWFEARKEEEVGVLWQAWSGRSFCKNPRVYKEAGRGEVWPKEEELLAAGRRFANFS